MITSVYAIADNGAFRPANLPTHEDVGTSIRWTVSQTFEIFGDPCERTFSTAEDAETYADELAESLADSFYTRSGDYAIAHQNETYSSGVGLSREVEWVRNLEWEYANPEDEDSDEPDDCVLMRMPWSTLVAECSDAVEIRCEVVVCGEPIEDHHAQKIAIALINAMDAGDTRIRYRSTNSPHSSQALLINNYPVKSFEDSEEMLDAFRALGIDYPCKSARKAGRERVIQGWVNTIQNTHYCKYDREISRLKQEIREIERKLSALNSDLNTITAAREKSLPDLADEIARAKSWYDYRTKIE